jgi:hypothetical protein
LGELAGFGIVHPLPGIVPGLQINSAITLPVGVEAYAAYALGAWLAPGARPQAKGFARRSAIGALILGMAGQVAYHLLAAEHATVAPWPVTVLVSCLPVAVLGLAAALTHLLRQEEARDGAAEPAEGHAGRHAQVPVPFAVPEGDRFAELFAPELIAGTVPGIRKIKSRARVGSPRATDIRRHLEAVLAGQANHNGHRA